MIDIYICRVMQVVTVESDTHKRTNMRNYEYVFICYHEIRTCSHENNNPKKRILVTFWQKDTINGFFSPPDSEKRTSFHGDVVSKAPDL